MNHQIQSRLQLQMSVWSVEALLLLLFLSQPTSAAAHYYAAHAAAPRRFVSFGRVPFFRPERAVGRSSMDSSSRSATPTPTTTNATPLTTRRSKSFSRNNDSGGGVSSHSSAALVHARTSPAMTATTGEWTCTDESIQVAAAAVESSSSSSSDAVGESRAMAQFLQADDDDDERPPPVPPSPQLKTAWMRLTANRLPRLFGDNNLQLLRGQADASTKQEKEEQQPRAMITAADSSLVVALTQPLMEETVWNQLTGTEFQEHPELLDALAVMGEEVALNDAPNAWIDWHVYGSGGSSTRNHSNNHNKRSLKDGAIHVWTGKCVKEGSGGGGSGGGYFGSQLPFIKTRSIIPLAVDEMVELLLDSTRVQTYNPWSLGRRDCWVANDGTNNASHHHTTTKIVKNRVQPPLGSKPMVSTTLLHARPAPTAGDGSWIVVSRSVGGCSFADPDDATAGRSDILLGVNLLQPSADDEDSCVLTAVTHVYSSAVPTMLAERLGVKSAIKFVKDMRGLKVAAAAAGP